jgi:hypothetical protein
MLVNDLIELVEDLEAIELYGTETTAFEDVITKWIARRDEAIEFNSRQLELEF